MQFTNTYHAEARRNKRKQTLVRTWYVFLTERGIESQIFFLLFVTNVDYAGINIF